MEVLWGVLRGCRGSELSSCAGRGITVCGSEQPRRLEESTIPSDTPTDLSAGPSPAPRNTADIQPITDPGATRDVAARIAAAGRMAIDVEFVSEGRYIPELSLLQLAWGDAEAPADAVEIAVIDCVATDPAPILALIEREDVETVAHSARQDLGLLAARHGITARNFWDTQIAAAFLGIGEQVGYARLVELLLGVTLDKGAQFTAWLDRPLSARQLRYAADDVRYLPRLWRLLRARLLDQGRLAWVEEESRRLAGDAMPYGPAEDAYRTIKGWRTLRGRALAVLRGLAAWRQTRALAENKPLSWVLPDQAMLELCKRGARGIRSPRDVQAVRGIGEGLARRYGADIVAAIQASADQAPPPAEPPPPPLSARAQTWAAIIAAIIQARCTEAGIAQRFVGTRADAEALAAWFDEVSGEASGGADAGPGPEPALGLLQGWRRELAGAAALAWLRGDLAIRRDPDRDDVLVLVEPAP